MASSASVISDFQEEAPALAAFIVMAFVGKKLGLNLALTASINSKVA
jgi:hypothetical protein